MSSEKHGRKTLYLSILIITIGAILIGFSFIPPTPKCTVKSFDGFNCYERNSKLYLERYYNLNNTDRKLLILCGAVLNCDTSPCYDDIIVTGDSYYCREWNKHFYSIYRENGLKIGPEFARTFASVTGSIICLLGGASFIWAAFCIYLEHRARREYLDSKEMTHGE